MVKIVVDSKTLEVEEGTILLQACLEKGIYIPNLCYLKKMEHPSASCRMCFVEIEGEDKPLPSCTVTVWEGMVVRTHTPTVRRLQESGFRLLISVHEVDCAHCPANKKCELQRMAKFLHLGLKPKGLETTLKEPKIIQEHPFIDYYPNRCVLCGKCIHVCRMQHGQPQMTFAKRGFDTVVSFFGENGASSCEGCFACVEICPVAAITVRNQNDPQTTTREDR
ncbi:MAG: 2Fe-2S iron-sulfur cluster-binding protein [Desulfobacteraceae bacterium]|jgi:NADH dehydrogenase/NADH:ubiquinone oxidoreductase subunit G